ncbi:MAG: ACP phosphodiesterase [Flavobacteriales bacterium]|jgi:acyl carrier protein phosphodiesterase|nr:ACP phosphodiesterase [Flavobacteriales bacterium]
MNFLGHAYIARNHPFLIAGNFAGDSYKGKLDNFNDLPKHILDGIHLHRFIDDFTDTSDQIKEVAHIFLDNGIEKVGFIASDIILDHHLSREWKNYSEMPYFDFIEKIYHHTDPELDTLKADFQFLYSKLKQYQWLHQYPQEDGIQKILSQFSRRIRFENDLDKSLNIYKEHKPLIDNLFSDFLKHIDEAAEDFILDKLI